MPIQGKRKIIGFRTSNGITLPKGWIEFLGIKKGDEVPFICDNVLIFAPPNKAELLEKFKHLL